MNKKYLLYAGIFFVTTLIFFGAAFLYRQNSNAGIVRGEYAFAHTRNNLRMLSRIWLKSPESEAINLYSKNGEWHFKEAKDYFVNTRHFANFYTTLNNALIKMVYPATPQTLEHHQLTSSTGTQVITYDNTGKILDKLIIGSRYDDDSVYAYFAQNKGYYYIIGPVGPFSGEPTDWIPYPLLSIDEFLIRRLIIRNQNYEGQKLSDLLKHSYKMQRVLDVLSFIGYNGVTAKAELSSEITNQSEPHTFDIVMRNGLIYKFEIYKIDDLYWLSINLKADKISRKEVPPFVRQNQKYFADWLFLLDTRQGKILYDI